MKRWRIKSRLWVLVVLGFSLAGCSSSPLKESPVVGWVTKVHDGDSIHITPPGSKRVVIRLAGIDAPEIDQAFGVASRDTLRSMILNKQAEARCHKADKYQRQVCVVYSSGVDVNLQMISAGMAWHYKYYQNEQSFMQRRRYSGAEDNAKHSRLGLWAQEAVAPWDYRQSQR